MTSEPGAYERLERFAMAARFYIEALEAHEKAPTKFTSMARADASTNYEVAKRALTYTGQREWEDYEP